jgi:hypothetical protein
LRAEPLPPSERSDEDDAHMDKDVAGDLGGPVIARWKRADARLR